MIEQVLSFWFEETAPASWWNVDPEFDALIASRFATTLKNASLGELFSWRSSSLGRLAEIVVLDQFSRNIYRDNAMAFSNDAMALVLAQEAVRQGAHHTLESDQRSFLLMPYMHSESPFIHAEAEKLFKAFAPDNNYQFELKHKAIIDRFGRYPHRNKILKRQSTPEEIEFLKQPGSSF